MTFELLYLRRDNTDIISRFLPYITTCYRHPVFRMYFRISSYYLTRSSWVGLTSLKPKTKITNSFTLEQRASRHKEISILTYKQARKGNVFSSHWSSLQQNSHHVLSRDYVLNVSIKTQHNLHLCLLISDKLCTWLYRRHPCWL